MRTTCRLFPALDASLMADDTCRTISSHVRGIDTPREGGEGELLLVSDEESSAFVSDVASSCSFSSVVVEMGVLMYRAGDDGDLELNGRETDVVVLGATENDATL